MNLVLHPQTRHTLNRIITHPPQALLIAAPLGSGKDSVAIELTAQLLQTDPARVLTHPYVARIVPNDKGRIGVEAARVLGQFLSLRPTLQTAVNRIVIISQAETLTVQAQNALLKTIEEPPVGTVIILTASATTSLLPTILSRVQHLQLVPPDNAELEAYFITKGYVADVVKKALLMSGGLPGLTHALLHEDTGHPLVVAADQARQLLKQSTFERLSHSDELAKDKQAWLHVLDMLTRMSSMAMRSPRLSASSAQQWHKILRACYDAREATSASGQLKLVTLQFLLAL